MSPQQCDMRRVRCRTVASRSATVTAGIADGTLSSAWNEEDHVATAHRPAADNSYPAGLKLPPPAPLRTLLARPYTWLIGAAVLALAGATTWAVIALTAPPDK